MHHLIHAFPFIAACLFGGVPVGIYTETKLGSLARLLSTDPIRIELLRRDGNTAFLTILDREPLKFEIVADGEAREYTYSGQGVETQEPPYSQAVI